MNDKIDPHTLLTVVNVKQLSLMESVLSTEQ